MGTSQLKTMLMTDMHASICVRTHIHWLLPTLRNELLLSCAAIATAIGYVMSSMFAFPSVMTQNATPDHACSMTQHTDSMCTTQSEMLEPL